MTTIDSQIIDILSQYTAGIISEDRLRAQFTEPSLNARLVHIIGQTLDIGTRRFVITVSDDSTSQSILFGDSTVAIREATPEVQFTMGSENEIEVTSNFSGPTSLETSVNQANSEHLPTNVSEPLNKMKIENNAPNQGIQGDFHGPVTFNNIVTQGTRPPIIVIAFSIIAILMTIVINSSVSNTWRPYFWLAIPVVMLSMATTIYFFRILRGNSANQLRYMIIISVLLYLDSASIVVTLYAIHDFALYYQARNIRVNQIKGSSTYFEVYEVTNQRYSLCVQAKRCDSPASGFSTYGRQGNEQFPITGVDAYNAWAYCDWIDRRLPTLQEWEQAALHVSWGSRKPTPAEANLYDPELRQKNSVAPVGTHQLGNTSDGIEDLIGNVLEWTSTVWPDRGVNARTWKGKDDLSDVQLTVIGGSYLTSFNATYAVQAGKDSRLPDLGIRCVQHDKKEFTP